MVKGLRRYHRSVRGKSPVGYYDRYSASVVPISDQLGGATDGPPAGPKGGCYVRCEWNPIVCTNGDVYVYSLRRVVRQEVGNEPSPVFVESPRGDCFRQT